MQLFSNENDSKLNMLDIIFSAWLGGGRGVKTSYLTQYSKRYPVAESIVMLKFGTSGKPFRQISMFSSESRHQYVEVGAIGNQFLGRPGYCSFTGVSISTHNALGNSFKITLAPVLPCSAS